MTDRYEKIREALEGLRERCAQEVERITARRRMVAAMTNNEAVKPCEVAAAIRKIDVQQHYECAVREIEALREEVELLRLKVAIHKRSREQLAEALREAYGKLRELHGCYGLPFPQAAFARYGALLRDEEEGR